jgi:hypothetical protein
MAVIAFFPALQSHGIRSKVLTYVDGRFNFPMANRGEADGFSLSLVVG